MTPVVSTAGWSLESFLESGANFKPARRVPATAKDLLSIIRDHESLGLPLVVEGFHHDPKWTGNDFTLDAFEHLSTTKDIRVRDVHSWRDRTVPLSEFITKSRLAGPLAKPDEEERLYGKDAECPPPWERWLTETHTLPKSVLPHGTNDLLQCRPKSSPVETLMCYIGLGDTFTPCHKDLCASSGQNLMVYTEDGGSSYWFMTASSAAQQASTFFQSIGQELDHETHVVTTKEFSKASFPVYVLEQKLGDLVLVPPRSCHQVVNYGGITIKMSWSRMTLKGLSMAYFYELPIYRRVCRFETYRVKSTIYYVLVKRTQQLRDQILNRGNRSSSFQDDLAAALNYASNSEHNAPTGNNFAKQLKELLPIYDCILREEWAADHNVYGPPGQQVFEFNDDNRIVCDFCGCDIFQSFFECHECDLSLSGSVIICPSCFVEGRSCHCRIMIPKQCRSFALLLAARTEVVKVLKAWNRGSTPGIEAKLDLKKMSPPIFEASLLLLEKKKRKLASRTCHAGSGHLVERGGALNCSQCHQSRCYLHLLQAANLHAWEAIYTQNLSSSHYQYHNCHKDSKSTYQDNFEKFVVGQEKGLPPNFSLLLAHNALVYSHCRPVKSRWVLKGWYDRTLDLCDDPDADPEEIVGHESQQEQYPVHVKSQQSQQSRRQNRAYVLVPTAPYPLSRASSSLENSHHSHSQNLSNVQKRNWTPDYNHTSTLKRQRRGTVSSDACMTVPDSEDERMTSPTSSWSQT